MKLKYLILFIFLLPKNIFAYDLFDTNEYVLKFNSNNINVYKEKKINEIKVESLQLLLKRTLNFNNYRKIEKKINLSFANHFILNMTINNENIVNNYYYAKIKINFNRNLLINYFIKNKISYIDRSPNKFLLIIYNEDNIQSNLLSKNNIYYNFLKESNNKIFSEYFLIPNLDFNDRFILNQKLLNEDFKNSINKFNIKYKTNYQIFLQSIKKYNFYNIKIYLIDENNYYLTDEFKVNIIDYEKILMNAYHSSLNKWKDLNQIDTSSISNIVCKINNNNIHELKFFRNFFKSNKIIKNFDLKYIKLNENIYNIFYYGNFDIFVKSLENQRLNLSIIDNECNIKFL